MVQPLKNTPPEDVLAGMAVHMNVGGPSLSPEQLSRGSAFGNEGEAAGVGGLRARAADCEACTVPPGRARERGFGVRPLGTGALVLRLLRCPRMGPLERSELCSSHP